MTGLPCRAGARGALPGAALAALLVGLLAAGCGGARGARDGGWLRGGAESRGGWLREGSGRPERAKGGWLGGAPAARAVAVAAGNLDGGVDVRLAVAAGAQAVAVEGLSLLARDGAGLKGSLIGRRGAARLGLAREGGDVAIDGRGAGTARLVVEGAGPLLVSVDGGAARRLRGRLEVIAQGEGLVVVNELPLERYLAGVVPLEVDAAWPLEALKAQAVASRTYALHRRQVRRRAGGEAALYDLEATVLDQVYGGAEAEDPRAVDAVAVTRGEWLAGDDGAPILAVFHSTAGGRTASAEEVWGLPQPYLIGAACPFDRESPVFEWRWSVAVAEVEQRLVAGGYAARGLADLAVRDHGPSGRARTVEARGEAGAVAVPATDLRRLLGYARLRSTAFEVVREGDAFRFDGRGAGHGVGMCQWGARGMALDGRDYRAILEFYYPGVRLTTDEPR